ncbi:MAG TPA: hypothetical protein VF984_03285 [Actinomycetota bacterium]
MKRTAPATIVLLATALAACSSGQSRDFARYYDPLGLFSTDLPAANQLQASQPQTSQSGPGLLSGVVATPPQPSPSPQSQLGGAFGGMGTQTAPSDQTVYEAFVVTTEAFSSLDEMVLFFLTGDPGIDVQLDRDLPFAGGEGRLVVADVVQGGQPTAGIAADFSLGGDGVGYLLVAIFPPGDWGKEESDFRKITSSFRPGVPPSIPSFPLVGGSSL